VAAICILISFVTTIRFVLWARRAFSTSRSDSGEIKKLILIGFMGSGKSSVAPLLAKRLGFTAVDADSEVVARSGCVSIRDIIIRFNEPHFRDLEAQVAASFRDSSSLVIAAGGGVIGRSENMEHLRHGGGVVVFLETSLEEVLRRVPDRSSRPLLGDPVAAQKLYHERLPVYRSYADIIVTTDGKSPSDLCSEILRLLESRR
jgi:shikimate kinase